MSKGNSVLSTGEVAKICNVALRTVQKWFDSGLIKGYRIPGGRDRRIPVDELARFLEEYNMPIPDFIKHESQTTSTDFKCS